MYRISTVTIRGLTLCAVVLVALFVIGTQSFGGPKVRLSRSGKVPYVLATGVGKSLHIKIYQSSANSLLKFTRENGKLSLTVWMGSNSKGLLKGANGIRIDSDGATKVSTKNISSDNLHVPFNSSLLDLQKTGVKIILGSTDHGPRLIVKTPAGESWIPTGDYEQGECKVIAGYDIALVFKMNRNSVQPIGAILVDTKERNVIGEVDFPQDVTVCYPSAAIDPTVNGLAIVDSGLEWIMLVDLKGITPEK